MAIRLQESGEVIISARAGAVRQSLTRLICQRIGDLEIVTVKISPTGVTRNGKKLGQVTITFDAVISGQLETM